ncbi:MAG: hypothetical protein KAT75_05100 [Dehalococcoidia bacterium]|nr:hypothetical protein [Dehalococcoidia bacterium]
MQAKRAILMLLLGMLLISALACTAMGGAAATPTPTPEALLTKCEKDRGAIQAAIYAYNAEHGEWPTADGQPGDIWWDKLVREYLDDMPPTNSKCDWQVNSDPEGEVCVPNTC